MKKNDTELSLEKKLISYSLMSAAFLAVPSTLEATVITVNVNHVIPFGSSYTIDFNGDGTNDIEIYATSTNYGTTAKLVGSINNYGSNSIFCKVVTTTFRPFAARLNASSSVPFSGQRWTDYYSAWMKYADWNGQSNKYFAVKFPISGSYYIGFVEVTVTPASNPMGPSITVNSYGYQDVAGADIPPGALPVELTSFTANQINNTVKLLWETATEVDNYGFSIERKSSFNKNMWEKIGFVEGHGNSNSPNSYQFIDNSTLNSGDYYYRLKQIDNNGEFEYSDEVKVTITPPDNYALKQNYPNPFNPTTAIEFTLPESGFVTLTVYNTLGEEVAVLINQQMSAGSYEKEFNASGLPSGTYIYKIMVGNKYTSEKKMLLLK